MPNHLIPADPTIRQRLETMLVERGMFPLQAQAVMDAVIADPASEPMNGRWTDTSSGYPTSLLAVIWISVERHTLAWIDANLPLAWFRPMFTGELNGKDSNA